jgi:Taurine catabolism dioxygenase TauD, TfdA family
MDLQAGDIQLINNYTILHSRTSFVDGELPPPNRHMRRLWLKFPAPWPRSAEFPAHMGYRPAQDTAILVEAEA